MHARIELVFYGQQQQLIYTTADIFIQPRGLTIASTISGDTRSSYDVHALVFLDSIFVCALLNVTAFFHVASGTTVTEKPPRGVQPNENSILPGTL